MSSDRGFPAKNARFITYQTYHHLLMHGWPAAVVVSILIALYAQERQRVFLLCLLTFHLHLLYDLVGSRGPTPGDLWPICYSEPLFRHPIWFWKHQWRLDGWQNQIIFLVIFVTSLWIAVKKGFSFVEVISSKADKIFVGVLKKWHNQLLKSNGLPSQ
jgi:hypothetical protein